MATKKETRRIRIKKSIKKRISGTTDTPRLSVFRSNKEIYAQVIDDLTGKTLLSASSKEADSNSKITKIESSVLVGKALAEKAVKVGIDKVVFDRNGYLYHGRVKALAEGAREGGLKF